jgi:hypothetical protein
MVARGRLGAVRRAPADGGGLHLPRPTWRQVPAARRRNSPVLGAGGRGPGGVHKQDGSTASFDTRALRRTFTSLLAELDVDGEVLDELLGHRRRTVRGLHYQGASFERKVRAVERLRLALPVRPGLVPPTSGPPEDESSRSVRDEIPRETEGVFSSVSTLTDGDARSYESACFAGDHDVSEVSGSGVLKTGAHASRARASARDPTVGCLKRRAARERFSSPRAARRLFTHWPLMETPNSPPVFPVDPTTMV